MIAVILNSGLGSRMGVLTKEHPKCMTDIVGNHTILSRQLSLLAKNGINDIIITTGYYDEVLKDYCNSLDVDVNFKFIKNPIYDKTNYIYSIYCAKSELLNEEIILLHGDLVFDDRALKMVLNSKDSCMAVSSTSPLPEKDFKAVLDDGKIIKVGIEFFENAVSAQPLYKLLAKDWNVWLNKIIEFCESGQVKCYAENAFNEISTKCNVLPLDVEDVLCSEIDTPEDLIKINNQLLSII